MKKVMKYVFILVIALCIFFATPVHAMYETDGTGDTPVDRIIDTGEGYENIVTTNEDLTPINEETTPNEEEDTGIEMRTVIIASGISLVAILGVVFVILKKKENAEK